MKTKTLLIILALSFSVSAYLLLTQQRPPIDLIELTGNEIKEDYRIKGVEAAQKDIKNGLLKLETYGYPTPSRIDYKAVLQEYDIELITVAGCVINNQIIGYSEGYNFTMREEIKRKHGPDFFKFVEQESSKRYQERVSKIKKHEFESKEEIQK